MRMNKEKNHRGTEAQRCLFKRKLIVLTVPFRNTA